MVYLLVERAQGLIGDVSVEWRTEDATAISSGTSNPDYLVSVNCIRTAYRLSQSF